MLLEGDADGTQEVFARVQGFGCGPGAATRYLAAVEDLYSRKIVGWSMSERIDSELVAAALQMAVEQEQPGAGLVAHSDRGVQYASDHYQDILARHAITCSMSRKANCWDNAPAESLFATIKKELVHQQHYATRDQARHALFEYIEVFYNRQRRHSALNYRTPNEVHHATDYRHREASVLDFKRLPEEFRLLVFVLRRGVESTLFRLGQNLSRSTGWQHYTQRWRFHACKKGTAWPSSLNWINCRAPCGSTAGE